MSNKSFSTVVGAVFSLVALLHLARAIYGWEVLIGGWAVPFWVSWAALVVALYLAYKAFSLARSSQ